MLNTPDSGLEVGTFIDFGGFPESTALLKGLCLLIFDFFFSTFQTFCLVFLSTNFPDPTSKPYIYSF